MEKSTIIFIFLGGFLFYLSNVVAYSFGVKHGRAAATGSIPNVNPIKVYKNKKEEEKKKVELDKFTEGLNNVLSYGEPFKKGVK